MVLLEHHAAEAVAHPRPEALSAAVPPGARGELVVDLELQHAAGWIALVSDAEIAEADGAPKRRHGRCASCVASPSRPGRPGQRRRLRARDPRAGRRRREAVLKRIGAGPPRPHLRAPLLRGARAGAPAARARLLRERPAAGRRRRLDPARAPARGSAEPRHAGALPRAGGRAGPRPRGRASAALPRGSRGPSAATPARASYTVEEAPPVCASAAAPAARVARRSPARAALAAAVALARDPGPIVRGLRQARRR